MKKHFRYGLFFALGAMLALGFVACGDESSSGPSKNEETGIETEISSSSEKDEAISSSSAKDEKSSSSKKVESSSSTEASSSSTKNKESSSSGKVESSSSKNEVSSSSKKVESSSSKKKDDSSSSTKIESSSSSDKPVESSSSKAKSSSSEISSSSIKIEESSSSVESSSSLNPVESSSSEMSSSSSPALNSIYDAENNTLTDLRDGQVYKTVTIGLQVWMAENLNYLPKDTAGTFWAGRSVCGGGEHKSHQEGDCSVYGRLYERKINGYDGFNKNICPDGWDVPTSKQWQVLVEFLGGNNVAGKAMKSNENLYWPDEDLTNKFGFSALPAGYYDKYKGYNSRCDVDELRAVFTVHSFNSSERNGIWINDKSDVVTYTDFGEGFYLSIRCIKK